MNLVCIINMRLISHLFYFFVIYIFFYVFRENDFKVKHLFKFKKMLILDKYNYF